MSEYDVKNGSSNDTKNEHFHEALDGDGFVTDNSCDGGYEQHEDHVYAKSYNDESYSRTEKDEEAFRSGSGGGMFYRRNTGSYNRNGGNYDNGGGFSEPMVGGKKNSFSALGLSSMICGIASLLFCCVPFVGLVVAIVGLVIGIVAQSKLSNGFAVAGIITSAFGIVFGIIMIVAMVSSIGDIGNILNSILDSSFPDEPFDPNNEAVLRMIKSVLCRL